MGLTMSEKRAVTDEVVRRYRKASKKEKGVILDEFVKTTGYKRKYAIQLLSSWGADAAATHRRTVGEGHCWATSSCQAAPPTTTLRPGGAQVPEEDLVRLRLHVRQASGCRAAYDAPGARVLRRTPAQPSGAGEAADHQRRHHRSSTPAVCGARARARPMRRARLA